MTLTAPAPTTLREDAIERLRDLRSQATQHYDTLSNWSLIDTLTDVITLLQTPTHSGLVRLVAVTRESDYSNRPPTDFDLFVNPAHVACVKPCLYTRGNGARSVLIFSNGDDVDLKECAEIVAAELSIATEIRR